VFHLSKTDETGFLPTVEFYQKVYVALEMRVTFELRSE
jgi:hypothetical protein